MVSGGHPLVGQVRCRGPFLEDEGGRVCLRGFTWGPFRGSRPQEFFPDLERVRADLAAMVRSGANVVRVYTPPPVWVLDEIGRSGLRVLVGLPWNQHIAFLENRRDAAAIRDTIRTQVAALRHPALLGCALANEVPETVVRWYGAPRVAEFLTSLVETARAAAPEALHTFATFPPTEDLVTVPSDLVLVNVHLNDARSLDAYLARLLTIADGRPLVLGEIGADAGTHGDLGQASHIEKQLGMAWRRGVAGAFVFAWTDEWFVPSADGGHDIEGWSFGVTTANRRPRAAYTAASRAFASARTQPAADERGVSVVVCARNAGETIEAALASLVLLRHQPLEILVIDDGSTDATAEKAKGFAGVRVISTPPQGLSAARNHGATQAQYPILAYTDADCVVDRDWLSWILPTIRENVVASGGPNLSLPHPGRHYATLAAAPGAPTHVLTSHDRAEHLAGCNLVVRRDVHAQIGGFDPDFTSAGDDADFCWRILDAGYELGFAPCGIVWHERRRTIRKYLRQQRGYGRAEAALRTRHARRCSSGGAPGWAGLIYGGDGSGPIWGREPMLYRQAFGVLGYLGIYGSGADAALRQVVLAPEWLLAGVLTLLAGLFGGVAMLAAGLGMLVPTLIAARRETRHRARVSAAAFERTRRDDDSRGVQRPLLTGLVLLGRAVRRFGQMRALAERGFGWHSIDAGGHSANGLSRSRGLSWQGCLWWEQGPEAPVLLDLMLSELERQGLDPVAGGGYASFDFRALAGLWWRIESRAMVEEHGSGRRLARFSFEPRVPLSVLMLLLPFLPLLGTSIFEGSWLGLGLSGAVLGGFGLGALVTLRTTRQKLSAALRNVALASGGLVLAGQKARAGSAPVPVETRVNPSVTEDELAEAVASAVAAR